MSNIDWSQAPEGATHWFAPYFYKVGSSGVMFDLDDQWHKSSYSKDELFTRESCISKPALWAGAGLPPVGTVCEYYIGDDKWRQCEIGAHKDGYAVIWITAAHVFSARSCGLLRPIRTPEQIEAEERESKVQAMLEITTALHISNMREAMEELYREGYRKQPKEDA